MATQVAPAGTVYNPQVPGAALNTWAADVLTGLNIPVNDQSMRLLMAWAQAESGSGNPNVCAGRFNPLNTTEGSLGFACEGGSQGNIKGYSSLQQGVSSTVYALTHENPSFGYGAIIDALRSGDAQAFTQAVGSSSWGTSADAISGVLGSVPASGLAAGAGTAGTATATETAATSSGCPEGNLIDITMPSVIPNIVFTRCNGRAWLGAAMILLGGGLMVVAVALMASQTRIGKAATQVATKAAGAAAL